MFCVFIILDVLAASLWFTYFIVTLFAILATMGHAFYVQVPKHFSHKLRLPIIHNLSSKHFTSSASNFELLLESCGLMRRCDLPKEPGCSLFHSKFLQFSSERFQKKQEPSILELTSAVKFLGLVPGAIYAAHEPFEHNFVSFEDVSVVAFVRAQCSRRQFS